MRFKKILIFIGLGIAGVLLLLFIFISPIAKYVIEKNSEEWIGRKIKIESLWLNIFTGSIHLTNFQLFESKSDKVFIGVHDFYGNIAVNKLLVSTYTIETIKISGPEINIQQHGDHFNFDDLMIRFADTTHVKQEPTSEPVKYFIDKFSIDSATINYSNFSPAASISIVNINASTLPIAYTDTKYDINTSFGFKTGGEVSAKLNVNVKTMAYLLDLKTKDLNIAFLLSYLKDYMKVKSLDGLVSSDLLIAGSLDKTTDVAAKGLFGVNDFSLIDTTGEKLASFEKYEMDIDSINTKASQYNFNSVLVDQPYVKFAMYDDGYNFDRILTEQATDTSTAPIENYSNVFQMMAGYIRDISKEYLLKEYRFDKMHVKNGHIIFTDYTVEDKFQYDLDSFNLGSDNFNSNNDRIVISLGSRLNKSGIMTGTLSVNPNGFEDMEINYAIKGLLLSDINPYSKYYVATPFMDGIMSYENNSVISNGKLKSTNKLFIEKIKVGNKVKNSTAYNLPVKLAVAILRDTKGNIDLTIPVEGDLKDPKYKIGKVVWQIFKNLIVKAATAPFNLLANAFGGKEEEYKEIQFQYLQRGISKDQQRVIGNLRKVMEGKPELKIEFVQLNNKVEEVDALGLYTAKKQYLGFESDSLSPEQEKTISLLSAKDSLFQTWVDSKVGVDIGLTSIQEKCIKYLGKEKLESQVAGIMEQRNSVLMNEFVSNGITAERVKISNVKPGDELAKQTIPRYVVNFFTE